MLMHETFQHIDWPLTHISTLILITHKSTRSNNPITWFQKALQIKSSHFLYGSHALLNKTYYTGVLYHFVPHLLFFSPAASAILEPQESESEADDSDDVSLGGIFKMKTNKKVRDDVIHSRDCSLSASLPLQDWDEPDVLQNIRDCFVTGKWKESEDAEKLLEQDDMSEFNSSASVTVHCRSSSLFVPPTLLGQALSNFSFRRRTFWRLRRSGDWRGLQDEWETWSWKRGGGGEGDEWRRPGKTRGRATVEQISEDGGKETEEGRIWCTVSSYCLA